MEKADDLDAIAVDPINSQIRQFTENEFPCIRASTSSSVLREFCQKINLAVNGERHFARGGRTAMRFYVIADMSEIANRCIRPAEAHQPGYRSSIIFLTTS